MFSQNFFQLILAAKWSVWHSKWFKYVPQPAATTFAFSSVFIFFYAVTTDNWQETRHLLSQQLNSWHKMITVIWTVQQLSQGGRSMTAAWQLQDNCMTSEQLSSEWQLSVQAAWVILSKPFKTNSVVSRDHCQFCNSYEAITKWTKVSKHLIVITWKEIRNVVSCKSSWLAVMV